MARKKQPEVGQSRIDADSKGAASIVSEIEALYRRGNVADVLGRTEAKHLQSLDSETRFQLAILRGMSLFDLGDAVNSLDVLGKAVAESASQRPDLQFSATFSLFVRAMDFRAPADLLPLLIRLRQIAALVGDAASLSGLHLAVARFEGVRGHCVDAHRHLEIARRLADRSMRLSLRCSVELIEASLESIAGNLVRSRQLAEACFRLADSEDFLKYKLGSATNLGVVALYSLNLERAVSHLRYVLSSADSLTYVKFGALDTLASVELQKGNYKRCAELLDECRRVLQHDNLPARSWYDLAHDLTRCAYFERLEDWDEIVAIAEAADPELARRQYKAIRTALLCAKARALARQRRHQTAESALAAAVRTCPRGAVDPLIVLEASKAIVFSLRGDIARGSVHFDRATAAARAIGHKLHESWIDRQREAVPSHARVAAAASPRVQLDVTDTAILLGDVATMLGAGHSVDLLAHRLAAILQGTSIGSRVDVESESGCEYQADPTARCETEADGAFHIRLRGSDRRVAIHVSGVQTIDEISLLKSIGDLVQAAVNRTADTENEDEDQNLWPRATLEHGDDAIFRSPRMAELLEIAIRLASTPLPVLITGETGTGKEVIARIIHEHSAVKRGPFVPFNCSNVPRELVESQLFGHRRGAFTGALDSFPGIVRTAEHGTLFLDELGDLDPSAQPKLLRFLERSEIHPVGESRPQHVAVRIVAATNANVDHMMAEGRFRRDLFYRVGGAHLALPPLRERKDEIPALASLFLSRFARECQRTGVRLGDDFIAALLLYDWPGNIRQLANEVRRVVAMARDGETIKSGALSPDILGHWNARAIGSPAAPAVSIRLDQTLARATEELERAFIERALDASRGRVAEAAQLLGLSRKGLFLKRRRRGLTPRQARVS